MTNPDGPDERDAPRAPVGCAHCGLPVTGARGSSPVAYCCVGCRLAAAIGRGGPRGTGSAEARLLLSAFLAMGVMTFSLVLYGETIHGAPDEPALAALRNLGRATLALFSLPVLVLLGVPLLRGAWADLVARRVRMDGLIVLATFAAFALSLAHTWTGTGAVYYDTATMVLVLVTFGRRLEAHARTHGRNAAEALADLLPETGHRLAADGRREDVAPSALRPGESCVVLPGEAVPADGRLSAGRGEIVCAHLTGEQEPRAVGPGDEIPAGALNGPAALTLVVSRAPAGSTLARLAALLEAPLPSTRAMRRTDRLAGWLAGVAIALAVLGAMAAWRRTAGDLGGSLAVALSVLLVACPCALGLAMPLAYRAMRAALARRGLLVHDAGSLERAAEVDVVLLDKTGTLTDPTAGRLAIEADDPADRARLAALVAGSGHALARSLPADLRAAGAVLPLADVQLVPGEGASGRVDGRPCRVGRPEWLDAGGACWSARWSARRASLAASGQSLVALESEGRVVALGALEHALRPGARQAVRALADLGVRASLLSGDRAAAVAAVAGQLGIAGEGELRPEQKLERIRHLAAEGRCVLMAGDGVNDAPALREADVGVAVGSGTAAARGQAGIELVGDDLAALAALIRGARALRRTVRANFAWTLLYNALLLSWAASGRLDPLAAAVAMIVSSLIVSVRSYRLLDWTPDAARPGPADARPDALPGESARGPERHAAWAATGGAPR